MLGTCSESRAPGIFATTSRGLLESALFRSGAVFRSADLRSMKAPGGRGGAASSSSAVDGFNDGGDDWAREEIREIDKGERKT